MSLQFVKSAVLTSDNGIDFSKEEVLETDEVIRARQAAERASHKSLYEQLADRKEKQQAEYDANTKLLFAPPKAIDEEEYTFLQSVEDQRQRTEFERKLKEEKALEEFRNARKLESLMSESSSLTQPKITIAPAASASSKPTSSNMPKINATIKVKRKVTADSENATTKDNTESENYSKQSKVPKTSHTIPKNDSIIESKNDSFDKKETAAQEENDDNNGTLSLLCGYGSDDDA